MISSDLTKAQLEILTASADRSWKFYEKLSNRMFELGFPPDDKLYELVKAAESAAHGLRINLFYRTVGRGVGRPERDASK